MRWIRQRTATDCGVAAVAMVADVSYEKAKMAFKRFPGRGFETEAKDLRSALKNLGLHLSKRPRPLRGAIKIRLKSDAIALVRLPDDNENHWIVWDACVQQLLDPMWQRPNATYDFREYFKVKRNR